MKKQTLLKLIFTASCLLAAYCLLNNRETIALNQLAFQNIEALADPEIEVGVPCIMTSQTCYEINDDLGHTVIPGYK